LGPSVLGVNVTVGCPPACLSVGLSHRVSSSDLQLVCCMQPGRRRHPRQSAASVTLWSEVRGSTQTCSFYYTTRPRDARRWQLNDDQRATKCFVIKMLEMFWVYFCQHAEHITNYESVHIQNFRYQLINTQIYSSAVRTQQKTENVTKKNTELNCTHEMSAYTTMLQITTVWVTKEFPERYQPNKQYTGKCKTNHLASTFLQNKSITTKYIRLKCLFQYCTCNLL